MRHLYDFNVETEQDKKRLLDTWLQQQAPGGLTPQQKGGGDRPSLDKSYQGPPVKTGFGDIYRVAGDTPSFRNIGGDRTRPGLEGTVDRGKAPGTLGKVYKDMTKRLDELRVDREYELSLYREYNPEGQTVARMKLEAISEEMKGIHDVLGRAAGGVATEAMGEGAPSLKETKQVELMDANIKKIEKDISETSLSEEQKMQAGLLIDEVKKLNTQLTQPEVVKGEAKGARPIAFWPDADPNLKFKLEEQKSRILEEISKITGVTATETIKEDPAGIRSRIIENIKKRAR